MVRAGEGGESVTSVKDFSTLLGISADGSVAYHDYRSSYAPNLPMFSEKLMEALQGAERPSGNADNPNNQQPEGVPRSLYFSGNWVDKDSVSYTGGVLGEAPMDKFKQVFSKHLGKYLWGMQVVYDRSGKATSIGGDGKLMKGQKPPTAEDVCWADGLNGLTTVTKLDEARAMTPQIDPVTRRLLIQEVTQALKSSSLGLKNEESKTKWEEFLSGKETEYRKNPEALFKTLGEWWSNLHTVEAIQEKLRMDEKDEEEETPEKEAAKQWETARALWSTENRDKDVWQVDVLEAITKWRMGPVPIRKVYQKEVKVGGSSANIDKTCLF